MNTNQFDLSEELIQVQYDIAEIMVSALRRKLITFDDLEAIGNYATHNIELAYTPVRFLNFMRDLARRWHVFDNLYQEKKLLMSEEHVCDETIDLRKEEFV